ncbi:MAG: hypothetical protein ACI9WU_002152 [Myxococcota bacterium]|jgi:hypothetical protein
MGLTPDMTRMHRRHLFCTAALLGLVALLAACKGEEADKTAAEAPLGALSTDPASASTALASVSAPQATSSQGLARRLLSESLNATVDNVERLVDAPLYRLALDVDWELFTYAGHATIELKNAEREALTELVFLTYPNSEDLAPPGARNLAVGDVTVDGTSVKPTHNGSALFVPLPTPLAPGARTTIDLRFRGNIVRLAPGAGDMQQVAVQQVAQMVTGARQIGGYGVFSYSDDIVSLALWYPVLASYDEDGWDLKRGGEVGDVSYFDVSNYELTVTAPRDVAVVASGVETGRTENGASRTTTFAAGAMREVAVQMSRRYESETAFVDGVQVRSWFLESDRGTGLEVLKHGKTALKQFNELFGPYPYAELDLVEAPLIGGAGGVEFPGLVTIGKMFYAADSEPDEWRRLMADSPYIKDTLEFVVAHEVAHQWWNAVVGSDSKRHPFVDEALANHSAILYFERVHGREAAELQRDIQLILPWQIARMAGSKDRPVDLPTDQFDGALEYAATVYGKGALWFGMMRERFGDKSHVGFLSDYYKKHRFGVAQPSDLIDGLVGSARDPKVARAIADRWLKEAHGDDDIPSVKWGRVATYLMGSETMAGELGKILELMDNDGAAQIAKIVQNLLSEDGEPAAEIDYGAIARLFLEFQGADDTEADILAGLVRMLTTDPEALSSGNLRDVLKGLAKGTLGGDGKTDALIDIADALLKLLAD